MAYTWCYGPHAVHDHGRAVGGHGAAGEPGQAAQGRPAARPARPDVLRFFRNRVRGRGFSWGLARRPSGVIIPVRPQVVSGDNILIDSRAPTGPAPWPP